MAMSTSVSQNWRRYRCEIIEGYGLTECSVVSVNIPGKVRVGTVGHLVPETECKVVDDEENEVPPGDRGELWVKVSIMLGYWEKETKSRLILLRTGLRRETLLN